MTKSATRLSCQRQTRGAANRARKSMQGKPRAFDLNNFVEVQRPDATQIEQDLW